MCASFGFAGSWKFPRMLGFYECFQAGKAGAPEAAVLFKPRVYGAERLWIYLVHAVAPFTVFADQVGAAQQPQVFGNGRPRDWKGSSNLSSLLAAPAEKVEDGPAGGIGQRLESRLGVAGRGICNRTVTHNM
jgi:hypothetical protein